MSGKRRFLGIVRAVVELARENECGWTEEQFEQMAASMEQMIQLNARKEVSRDGAARILGCSTRTLQRMVANGEVKPPHRNGDKSGIKFYVDELAGDIGATGKTDGISVEVSQR